MKRIRFSLASLLLSLMLLCSGVLLYDKWPAWEMKQSWPYATLIMDRNFFTITPEMHRHYFSRLAGVEAGSPESAYPKVLPKVNLPSHPDESYTLNEQYAAYSTPDKKVVVYSIDRTEPICVLEYKDPARISMVLATPPHAKMLVIIETAGRAELEFVDLTSGKVINRTIVTSIQRLHRLLEQKGKWYLPIEVEHSSMDDSKLELIELTEMKFLPVPSNRYIGRYYLKPLGFLNADEPILEILLDTMVECSTLQWDFEKGVPSSLEKGYCTHLRDWRVSARPATRGMRWFVAKDGKSVELEGPFIFGMGAYPFHDDGVVDISLDGAWILGRENESLIWESSSGRLVEKIPCNAQLITTDNRGLIAYRRNLNNESWYEYWAWNHPSVWYGIAYRIEFWLTLFLSILLIFSIRKDFRSLKARA